MTDFYMWLPSNTNLPGNKTNDFKVILPAPVNLEGEWEMCLASIVYPHTWFNISKDDTIFKIYILNKKQEKNPWHLVSTRAISDNNYVSTEQLIQALNLELVTFAKDTNMAEGDPRLKFYFDPLLGRVVLKMKSQIIMSIELSEKLQYMLGYSNKFIGASSTTFEGNEKVDLASFAPDMLGGLDQLFIYCDLCCLSILGDQFASILATVPVQGKFPDVQHYHPVEPHYIPLQNKSFETVKILIKTDTNRLVPFNFGKIMLQVHCRKKRLFLK